MQASSRTSERPAGSGPGYFLGHSEIELNRLMAQAIALRPITERLLRSAGLQPGMRVLDIGCGAGDVSMLAAELVGPRGAVVGIDPAAPALALARARMLRQGLQTIEFRQTSAADLVDPLPFDFVVGRYVLLHQPDPAAMIRDAAARLPQGGIVAFHEIDMRTSFHSLPAAPRFDALAEEVMAAIRADVPHPDAAARLVSLFIDAGLSPPTLFCERPAGAGARSTINRWLATSVASIRELNRPTEPAIDAEILAGELEAELVALKSQVLGADQCCAWSVKPAH